MCHYPFEVDLREAWHPGDSCFGQWLTIRSSGVHEIAEDQGFTRITSSPRYPQSNGKAERAVHTVKNLLKKSADPYNAFLSYRATPLECGYWPSPLLMGSQLRTKIPVVPSTIEPRWVESKQLQDKQETINRKQKKTYDHCHRARPLGILQSGDSVWVQDAKTSGTVSEQTDSPRSHLVRTPTSCLRRNRRHLVSTPNEHTSVTVSPSTSCQDRRSRRQRNSRNRSHQL